ncbi:MAG: class III signal peptide-containing protein, partial [Candidatus Hydrothermarchaeaceae archaeon]
MGEEKAQISLEFVLIVGAFLVIAITVFPVITKQNELNKALTAARDGATFGAGMRGMGFRGEDVDELPGGVVKIDRLELELQGKEGELDWYRIRIYLKVPEYMKDDPTCTSSSMGSTVTNQALIYINHVFNGEWPSTGVVSRVNTTHYSFT